MIKLIWHNRYLFVLVLIIVAIYYKLFLFGKIPFPADLLVTSYSPWLDYYKFPTQNPLISDIFSQFFLWKYLSIDAFKNLTWPLWNPYSFSGTPLLATYHSGALYPLNILLLFPGYFGWGLFIFSSTLIAAITMYIFLSALLRSKIASVLGAIIYSFSGLMTTWVEFGTAVHGMAWIPLILFSILKYDQAGKPKYLLLLIVSVVLAILSGNAQVTTYTFLIIGSFSLFCFWAKNIKNFLKRLVPTLIALIIAIGISMPQLLPSLDLLNKSIRTGDTYTEKYNFGLLPLREVFKFFVADFYGNPVTRNYWGFLNYSETSSYLGSLSLPLLIFSVIYLRKNKYIYFTFGIFFFALLLAFDNSTSRSIYQMNLPLLTSSFASRMLFMVTLSVSIICAFAVNQIITEKDQEKNFLRVVIWSIATFLGLALGTYISSIWVKNLIDSIPTNLLSGVEPLDPEYSLTGFKTALRNTTVPTFLVSIFFLSLLITRKIHQYRVTLSLLLLTLLLVVDLGRYFLKFNPFSPAEYIFPQTPSIEFLQSQPGVFRVGREHAEVLPPNTWTAYNLQSIEGYDPIYLSRYTPFIHFLNNGVVSQGNSDRYVELSGSFKSPFLDAANVKYFIGILRDRNGHIGGDLMNYKFNEAKYPVVFRERASVVVENPEALNRVYFPKTASVVNDQEVKKIIDSGNFNPKEQVLLTKDLNFSTPTGSGEAKILSYKSNSVDIQTKITSEEILILADQYEEGWHAKIDGQEVPISPANLIFRAIKIPAGNHNVTFYYWPASFSTGLKIAALSIIFGFLCLIINSILVKQSRKPNSH